MKGAWIYGIIRRICIHFYLVVWRMGALRSFAQNVYRVDLSGSFGKGAFTIVIILHSTYLARYQLSAMQFNSNRSTHVSYLTRLELFIHV
jgi:hypothetical protein